MTDVVETNAMPPRGARPVVGIDVDGVIAVANPARTPVHAYRVSAWGRWSREILVPVAASATLARLAQVADLVWISAWGHVAPGVLTPLLDLDEGSEAWPYLPTQFGKAQALADYAHGRRWALIHDDVDNATAPAEGLIVVVDPHVGIAEVDIEDLIRRLP